MVFQEVGSRVPNQSKWNENQKVTRWMEERVGGSVLTLEGKLVTLPAGVEGSTDAL